VPAVTAADLILPPPGEGSREVAARVARARDIQSARYAALGLSTQGTNAQVSGSTLEKVAQADSAGMALLRDAADSMRLSARGYGRSLIWTARKGWAAYTLLKPCLIVSLPTRRVVRRNIMTCFRYRALYVILTTFARTACDQLAWNKIARFGAPNGLARG